MADGGDPVAPDVTRPDDYSGLMACGQLTVDKVDEYAALVKFVKLLAGYGPEAEVAEARQTIIDALNQACEVPDYVNDARVARDAAYERMRQTVRDMGATESQAWDVANRPFHPGITEVRGGWAIDGVLIASNEEFIAAREEFRQTSIALQEAEGQQFREEWRAWVDGWIEWFQEIRQKLSEGRVLQMICAVLVEGIFIVAEEVVTWGIAAIAGAVTGGIGAFAVKIAARATIAGTRTAMISVRAVRVVGSEALTRQALGRANDVPHPRPIDASDLDGPEANILNEDLYGGHGAQSDIDGDLKPEPERGQTTRVNGDGDGAPTPVTSGRQLTDEEWAPLRESTPNRANRRVVQSQHPKATPENPVDDPWLPGHVRTSTIQADHIVPAARIRRMDGFADLTHEHQLEVLNFQDNFHGLSSSANASRGDLSFRDWEMYHKGNIPVNPQLRQAMIAEEERLEGVIQGMIYDRIRKQNSTSDVPFRRE